MKKKVQLTAAVAFLAVLFSFQTAWAEHAKKESKEHKKNYSAKHKKSTAAVPASTAPVMAS